MVNYLVTRKGLQRLHVRLQEMTEEMRNCITKMGESANDYNDLRENPEFMQLRTKATYELPNAIAELERILSNISIIEEQPEIASGMPTYVVPGCMVELESPIGNRTIHILGVGESVPDKGIVSYETPVGQALLDLEQGDEVRLPLKGKTVLYEIVNIKISPYIVRN